MSSSSFSFSFFSSAFKPLGLPVGRVFRNPSVNCTEIRRENIFYVINIDVLRAR